MALPDAAAAPLEGSWDEGLWEELLAYIEAGIVVPIIGPAAYPVAIGEHRVALDCHVATRLAARLALPTPPAGASLNDVVSAYLHTGGRRERLYPTIHAILQEAALAPPEVLTRLAEIRHFDLFVTIGFDPLLAAAIDQARFAGEPRTRTIAYAPNNKQDLPPAGAGSDGRPIVYHLFGKASALPNSYAISDEDLLEFLYALQSDSRRPENLLDRLESVNLLLIGANFPDWVARMFLRTAKGRRLSESRPVLEILADEPRGREPSLVAFLTHFSPRTTIFPGEPGEFVETLWQRWRERHGGAFADSGTQRFLPPPAEMPENAIFISYAREDIDAVRALRAALDAAGLDVWFDFERLDAGDSFDRMIRQNIRRCALFLPVLSRHTEARPEGFFRREWRYALDRDLDIDPGRPFIVPLAIDDGVVVANLPARFAEINIVAAPEGQPTAELIARLKRIAGR